ncbi:ORC-CDC6 family AAA ATPase [Serratia surfactantfaciens]|uniref:ORC-CDC6 family AAA ATPase n=1 Tax=Serratia surfactantfaciens TaxID=2741499 RepID=UPI003EE345E6
MKQENPFTLAHASGFTDKQINSFWTDLGSPDIINSIFEPKNKISKFILGGKGTGKTHLLRYYSYNVTRLRNPSKRGIDIVKDSNFLAVFQRAAGVDSTRFEVSSDIDINWQQLFGIYLELKLAESVIEALCDIKDTSDDEFFDDVSFVNEIRKNVTNKNIENIDTLEELKNWLVYQRKTIDDAVNEAAFTGQVDLKPPFGIGKLCLTISTAINVWHPNLAELTVFYLIDEIENFSLKQQEVVNTLIRYGESKAIFRVTGRRYAIKTYATLANGEENRLNSEFKTVILDDLLLKSGQKFSDFAKKLILQRLRYFGDGLSALNKDSTTIEKINFREVFEEIIPANCFTETISRLAITPSSLSFTKSFKKLLEATYKESECSDGINEIVELLTFDFPLVIQKLNILLYVKKIKKDNDPKEFAKYIHSSALSYLVDKKDGFYSNAYGHYATDIFAQLCKDSSVGLGVVYAGFDNIIKMTSANPRNLLIILSKMYDISIFRDSPFFTEKLSIEIQTEALLDSAKFMYEADTNFGFESDIALRCVDRLAAILKTARFAINIPEVSPLSFSFSNDDLSEDSKKIIQDALNYSLLFEMSDGRADRNSQKVIRKLELNPMLSPRWSLPVSRRGDISLNKELLAAVFSSDASADFDIHLKKLSNKWNSLIKPTVSKNIQGDLFDD